MLTAQEIVTRKITRNITFPIVLFFLITIGNYSFFRYSPFGESGVPTLLQIIPYSRIILPLWVVAFSFKFNFGLSAKIIQDNIDVLILAMSWFVSSMISLDISSYLLYGTWSLLSFLAVLLFVGYTALLSRRISVFFQSILQSIWIGNSIILVLGIGSVLLIRPGAGPYNILFSSNTFWAFPTMIMGIIALIRLKLSNKTKTRLFFLVLYLVCIYLVYISARRTPLFALMASPLLLYIPIRLPYILLLTVFLSTIAILANSVELRDITNLLPNSYTRYRIERMLGLVKGRQESSLHDRQRIWQIYIDSFYENPVLGAGLAANERITEQINKDLEGYSSHNTFVGLLAETGSLGTLLFILFLVNSLRKLVLLRNMSLLQIYVVLLIPTILVNWVEYNLIPGQIFFLYSVVIWMLPRGLLYLSEKEDFTPTP